MLAHVLPWLCLLIGLLRAPKHKQWEPKTDHERLYAAYAKKGEKHVR